MAYVGFVCETMGLYCMHEDESMARSARGRVLCSPHSGRTDVCHMLVMFENRFTCIPMNRREHGTLCSRDQFLLPLTWRSQSAPPPVSSCNAQDDCDLDAIDTLAKRAEKDSMWLERDLGCPPMLTLSCLCSVPSLFAGPDGLDSACPFLAFLSLLSPLVVFWS